MFVGVHVLSMAQAQRGRVSMLGLAVSGCGGEAGMVAHLDPHWAHSLNHS